MQTVANVWKIGNELFAEILRSKICRIGVSSRSRRALQNEYLIAKIGRNTAENGPPKIWLYHRERKLALGC